MHQGEKIPVTMRFRLTLPISGLTVFSCQAWPSARVVKGDGLQIRCASFVGSNPTSAFSADTAPATAGVVCFCLDC